MRLSAYLTCTCIALLLTLSGCGNSENSRTTRAPGEPASTAASKKETAPVKTEESKTPIITASSQTDDFGPTGLLSAIPPGWHSAQPPKYPEALTADFQQRREVKSLGLLQQEGQPARAPKAIRIDISDDGTSWIPVAGSDNACAPNTPDGWSNIDFAKPATGRYVKVVIFSNCGDPQFLTLRALRFG